MFIHDCDLLNVKKHSARPALLPISPGIIYYEDPLNILFLLLLFYCLFYWWWFFLKVIRVDNKDIIHLFWYLDSRAGLNKCGDLLFHLETNILCKYPFADRSQFLSHSSPCSPVPPSIPPPAVCRCPDLPSCIIMFLSGPHKGIIKEQPSHRYLISNTEMVRLHFVYIGLDTYYCWCWYTDTTDTVI